MRLRGYLGVSLLCLGLSACVTTGHDSKASDVREVSNLYVRKGLQYMENGNLDVALNDLQKAIEVDEDNVDAHNAVAILYERLNRLEDARDHYQTALSLQPADINAINNYGRFLCAHGEPEQGLRQFATLIDNNNANDSWVALTNAALCEKSAGKGEQAEVHLRKALEQNPKFAPALLEMAKMSHDSKQYMSARAFLQRYQEVADYTAATAWLGVQIESALNNRAAASEYMLILQDRFTTSTEFVEARRRYPDL